MSEVVGLVTTVLLRIKGFIVSVLISDLVSKLYKTNIKVNVLFTLPISNHFGPTNIVECKRTLRHKVFRTNFVMQ